MLSLAIVSSSLAFTPLNVPSQGSRPAVLRSTCTSMTAEPNTRREMFAKMGAALLGVAFVDSASAKAGQFTKQGFFGMNDLSSPYQTGGPQSGPSATFGYEKSSGDFLAADYESDVAREREAFAESSRRIASLQPYLDSKTWWFMRDGLRTQTYNMRSSMQALNGVLSGDAKAAAVAAYDKFWKKIETFDLACEKKEPALAAKAYADVLAALEGYTALV